MRQDKGRRRDRGKKQPRRSESSRDQDTQDQYCKSKRHRTRTPQRHSRRQSPRARYRLGFHKSKPRLSPRPIQGEKTS